MELPLLSMKQYVRVYEFKVNGKKYIRLLSRGVISGERRSPFTGDKVVDTILFRTLVDGFDGFDISYYYLGIYPYNEEIEEQEDTDYFTTNIGYRYEEGNLEIGDVWGKENVGIRIRKHSDEIVIDFNKKRSTVGDLTKLLRLDKETSEILKDILKTKGEKKRLRYMKQFISGIRRYNKKEEDEIYFNNVVSIIFMYMTLRRGIVPLHDETYNTDNDYRAEIYDEDDLTGDYWSTREDYIDRLCEFLSVQLYDL